MSAVFFDISVSLDGYVAGPNDGVKHPLGDGGELLHEWVYPLASFNRAHGREGGEEGPEDDLLAASFERAGATVMGRRMFDQGEGPWGEDPPFHAPVFVLTHGVREPLEKRGGTTFHFVTDGIEAAVEAARQSAGDRDVSVGGGGEAIRAALAAGLVDEFWIHLVPVLLGGGVRLFGERPEAAGLDLELAETVPGEQVTHTRYTVADTGGER